MAGQKHTMSALGRVLRCRKHPYIDTCCVSEANSQRFSSTETHQIIPLNIVLSPLSLEDLNKRKARISDPRTGSSFFSRNDCWWGNSKKLSRSLLKSQSISLITRRSVLLFTNSFQIWETEMLGDGGETPTRYCRFCYLIRLKF